MHKAGMAIGFRVHKVEMLKFLETFWTVRDSPELIGLFVLEIKH